MTERAPRLTRRRLLTGAAAVGGLATFGGLGACSSATTAGARLVGPEARAVAEAEAARTRTGRVVTARLFPEPRLIDLGGRVVSTWVYGDGLPGPVIRASAGDTIRVTVQNRLPQETSVHWHGIALRNDMDGVPGLTQDPIALGATYRYDFTAPDPGTYFYHPHTGLQLDTGLSGMLVIDDPADPGDYDEEWLVHLDDWVDGTGRTPDQVLTELSSHDMRSMGGGMGGMGMSEFTSPVLGGAGDVDYPLYLINGRPPDDPPSAGIR